MTKPWTILDAPFATMPDSAGTTGFARALRSTGLTQQIGAVEPAAATSIEDLVVRAGAILQSERRALVSGGDCSVAVASTALKGHGRSALAYIDGHSDFRHSGNLEAPPVTARSELALLTGRCGKAAIFRDDDTAAIAFRRDDPAFPEIKKTQLLIWPMFWLYEHSRQELDQSLLRRFDRPEIDRIWIHLDVDALDPALISAVPHPIPDGLAPPELVAILRTLLGTGKVAGMSIANLCSGQDTDNRQANVIADILTEAFAA